MKFDRSIPTLRILIRLSILGMLLLCGSPAIAADAPQGTFDVEFELTGASGEAFTQQNLHGKYTLLAFGFTNCQHICPMMVANMGLALKLAPENSLGVFISVDTERDTPEIAHEYASNFHSSLVGLSGTFEQVRTAANNFNVSFVVTKSQKAYTVEHTSDIILISPEGEVIDTFALNANPESIAAAMNP
jgi:protein SCO1/2